MENKELTMKATEVAELRGKLDDLKTQTSTVQDSFDKASYQLVQMLEALEINSVKMCGYNFYTQIDESVGVPKSPEGKAALFEFLKEKGLYDEMISVNSRSLNSLFKNLRSEALDAGEVDFTMPGVEIKEPFKSLRLRKI